MILNSGLDAACTSNPNAGSGSGGAEAWPRFCAFIQYAAIGTGSAAPAPSDTALGSQIASRSNNRGGFVNSEAGGFDPTANLIWTELTFTRVIDIASNVNATEWGLAPATTGSLSVRELFRADPNDNNSSPITLTLEGGDQLQLVVTFRVQANWEYASRSFTITGTAGNDSNGTHDGVASLAGNASGSLDQTQRILSAGWPGGPITGGTNYGTLLAFGAGAAAALKGENLSANIGSAGVMAADSYAPGSNYRDYVGTFGTSVANDDHYVWNVGSATNGFRFILTDPPYLTKASTHRLVLTVRKHISRL